MPPKQSDPQFKLRLDPTLKAALEKAAEEGHRSLSAEITSRLRFSFWSHPHAALIRALIELHGDLLKDDEVIHLPMHIEQELKRHADKRGLSSQALIVRLVLSALDHLDNQTEIGKKLDAALREFDDGPEADD